MRVGRWGNSLLVRLLTAIIEALRLQEGDEIGVELADHRTVRITHDPIREDALTQLYALSRPLPPGFRFSRDEANERTE